MPLASLTVDLTLALARFEADSGKAAQIVARDQDRMSSAAKLFERQLERLADQAGRTQSQFLSLKAAELGIGENTKAARLIEQIERQGTATAAATAAQVSAIRSTASAAEESADRQRALNDQLVSSIRTVNRAYEERRAALIAQEKGGQITPEQLKTGLSGLSQQRTDGIRQLKEQAALERQAQTQAEALAKAEREAAAAAEQAAAKQRLAAQQIVDGQNGLLASYRQRLQLLRELRDAGAITPAQFRTAGTDLVNQQPAVQRRRQEVEAAQAAAQSVADSQERAARQAAEAAEQSAARQRVAAQSVIDQQNGLSASYRARLQQLRELRDAELISPAQFRQAGTELVNQQPAIAARRAEAEAAKKAADEIVAAAQKKAAAETAATNAFVESIQRQADAIGKTRSQLVLEEAARRGVADQVRPYVQRIDEAEKSLNKFGRTSGVARYQLLTLQYTLSDTIASLASGISPLTILLQQGGQVADVFAGTGGVGGIFKAIGSVLTPVRIAIGGTAAAIGALGYAMYQGATQSREFSDAVTLSGNFSAQTDGKFKSLTRTIAESGEVNVASARAFGLALIQTGEIGGRNFAIATEAAARFGNATGKTAKEVATQFAALQRDVTAGAKTLNQELNFLSAAQLNQIRSLQESGRSTEAVALVYDALNGRLKQLEPNLGTLDRVLRGVSNTWKGFWDAAFDIGRTKTIADKVDEARAAAEAARRVGTERDSQSIGTDPRRRAEAAAGRASGSSRADAADEALRLLNRSQAAQEAAVQAGAELAKLNKDGADADEYVRGMDRRAKSTEGLKRALDEANTAFAKQDALAARDPNYTASTQAQRAAILARIREDFTDKPANTEANQVAKAERDRALKALQDSLSAEREAITFQNDYLGRLYDAGEISLETVLDKRREAVDRDLQEQLNSVDAQIAVQTRYLDFIKSRDPSEAIQTQKNIDSLSEQGAALVLERQRRLVLVNQDAAASFRALNERVTEYRAQLLQLEGDEEGAAKLRAQTAIANARLFAGQSGGGVSDADIRRQERALEVTNRLAEVQRRLGVLNSDTSRAEELFRIRAEQAGADLVTTEQGVFAVRSAALQQLAALTRQAEELARISTDPRVQQFAADLRLQFEKAAEAVSPMLERLRAAGKELASSIAQTVGQSIVNFDSLFAARRKENSSSGAAAVDVVVKDVINPLLRQINASIVKAVVQDPLEKFLQGQIRKLIDNSPFGEAIKQAIDPAQAAQATAITAQTAAMTTQTGVVVTATSSMVELTTAAFAAAAALSSVSGSQASGLISGFLPGIIDPGAGGGGFGGIFGDGFPMADGTNRVPYDGFRARLHKDEAVVPAKYNPAAGGGGGAGGGLKVFISNTASDVVEARPQRNDNGDLEVMIRRLVRDENARDLGSGGGVISKGLKSRGVNLNGGMPVMG